MTLLSSVQTNTRRWRRRHRGHLVPVMLGGTIAAVAGMALVAYLLWPTWEAGKSGDAMRLPVSVGATLFNVPTQAFRRKVQRHSGPQERVDLSFVYPSLDAPAAAKHTSAEAAEDVVPPIDRIFLSISAHHDELAPDIRVRTIYPRYLENVLPQGGDGLIQRAFRDGSPYGNEDLFLANTPAMVARCTRDAATPGMCLSERRIDGADLTFRFPRSWLSQWRDVAGAMDKLTAQLRGPRV
ncbi:hypothetical protein [uncultured Bradyrhizobium sp.]|uniref:hypothetical protein n=1 Tax=uncultured Bradyrhizobium sp. TaxID=199684 RepID=UPI0035CC09DA